MGGGHTRAHPSKTRLTLEVPFEVQLDNIKPVLPHMCLVFRVNAPSAQPDVFLQPDGADPGTIEASPGFPRSVCRNNSADVSTTQSQTAAQGMANQQAGPAGRMGGAQDARGNTTHRSLA